jgi:hypothetical protein
LPGHSLYSNNCFLKNIMNNNNNDNCYYYFFIFLLCRVCRSSRVGL